MVARTVGNTECRLLSCNMSSEKLHPLILRNYVWHLLQNHLKQKSVKNSKFYLVSKIYLICFLVFL